MLKLLKKIIEKYEPRFYLVSFSPINHEIRFELRDVDRYGICTLICKEVGSLCLTTYCYQFSDVSFFTEQDILPEQLSFFQGRIGKGEILIILYPHIFHNRTIPLPVFEDNLQGFILCENIVIEFFNEFTNKKI
jgi:hypothetical protein